MAIILRSLFDGLLFESLEFLLDFCLFCGGPIFAPWLPSFRSAQTLCSHEYTEEIACASVSLLILLVLLMPLIAIVAVTVLLPMLLLLLLRADGDLCALA